MKVGGARALLRGVVIVCGILVSMTSPAAAEKVPGVGECATVRTAVTTQLRTQALQAGSDQPGYLGIATAPAAGGRRIIEGLAANSPAERAGLRVGDVLLKLGDRTPRSSDDLRDRIQREGPGTVIPLLIEREGKPMEITATLDAPSRPLKLASRRAILGLQVTSLDDGEGLRVRSLTKDAPAVRAGLRTGDLLLKIDGAPLLGGTSLTDTIAAREPGEKVTVTYRRGARESEAVAELAPAPESDDFNTFTPRQTWKKPVFRLAVLPVEFADTAHNPAVPLPEWESFFFSTQAYGGRTNATGQAVHGSVNDYYREVSTGLFRFEGRVFDWIALSKKRADYSQGTASKRTRSEFFGELLDAVLKREGDAALSGFDGLAVIYAGERFPTANRGTLFWPHRGSTTHRGKPWPYVICAEGGRQMANISVFCHEFGHILGLPDLYARPENPGSEGVGAWCAMSNNAGKGRPQHFSAWCKEQLGWLHPALIDPAVPQTLVLSPVQGSTNECFKVLVRPDGAEYLLLENRQKTGFDQSLPSPGLLIWRVVGNRLMIEESHGVEGPVGPRVFLSAVPYPSASNDSFTPATTPSSRPQLGGGRPVHITNIRRIPDGRIAFQIGREYQ